MALAKNMGSADRTVRVLFAVAVAALYFTGNITGLAATLLGILAVVFVLTSLLGTCPLYMPLGIKTRK